MKTKNFSPVILIGIDAAVGTLTEKFLAEGFMPNLKTLIERGAYTRAASVFPGVTPINWATIATGAYPGTHGITDFAVLDPGDPLDGGRDGFYRSTYQAETIWDAAMRAGIRCATLDFPGAEARAGENHIWIAERGSPAGVTPYALRNLSCLVTPGLVLRDSQEMEKTAQGFAFRLDPLCKEGAGPQLTFTPGETNSGIKGIFASGFSDMEDAEFLVPGVASRWFWSEFEVEGEKVKASFRLELVHFDPHKSQFGIYVSQVCCPDDIADPPEIGRTLVEKFGPFIGYDGARAVDRGWVEPDHMVAEGRYKALWQAKAAKYLVEQENCGLVMIKWHLVDHIQHSFWGGIDPLSPWYKTADHETCWELIRTSYRAADEMIGELLPLLDQGVSLVVVSDHGHLPHLKAAALNNLFLKHGLISLIPGEVSPPQVDWNKTKVFGGPALGHIWINLKGRQPQGIVTDAEYEPLRDLVIKLLLDLKDPETGEKVVARAFKKEDAKEIGLWGGRTGDVVYWMKPGYSGDFNWTPLARDGAVIEDLIKERKGFAEYGEGKFIADKFQSVHGCGDPTAKLGIGTEEAIFAMAGPGINTGAKSSTLPNLTCVVPTMCAASNLPLPADNEGEALVEWLK